MKSNNNFPQLNLFQKLFLRFYCYPPPGRKISGIDDTLVSVSNPLGLLKNYFGDCFVQSIKDKVVLDIGCGDGSQVLGVALEGGKHAIGTEIRPVFEDAENRAKDLGIYDKVEFIFPPISKLGEASIDVAFSQNSFEHFIYPEKILNDVFYVLKKHGKFFITFGPPWLHPYGVHMFMMIKYPWAHVLFSEQTIMTVRKFYRSDDANRFEDVDGGLNKMTIRRFKHYVKQSGFIVEKMSLTPVKGLLPLVKMPFIREFFTSHISAILRKG
ncbi:MAG: class I SAM-dependent methyltransferase [Nitrospirota bacterium]|nr:class I SAM-dependent methyltransferase [Nitrospirota bacterium]